MGELVDVHPGRFVEPGRPGEAPSIDVQGDFARAAPVELPERVEEQRATEPLVCLADKPHA